MYISLLKKIYVYIFQNFTLLSLSEQLKIGKWWENRNFFAPAAGLHWKIIVFYIYFGKNAARRAAKIFGTKKIYV